VVSDRAKFEVTVPLTLRELSVSDYDKEFIPLLAQLTKVGSITREFFVERTYHHRHV
jgi:hypothetical protein